MNLQWPFRHLATRFATSHRCVAGLLSLAVSISLIVSPAADGGVAEFPATADNSIVMVDGEWSLNAGGASRLRIKGNQHIVALGFDLTPLAGKRVTKATLLCHADAERLSGVTISTIAAHWSEMGSTGLTAGIAGIEGWGSQGGRFPAVAGGNSFTLAAQATSPIVDGVYRWEIPVDMVHAMACGVAFGLAIHEHDADYGRNPTIFSREQSGKGPRLVVEYDDAADASPETAGSLRVMPIDRTTAELHLQSPAAGFAYDITLDGEALGRHNIPLVQPGSEQRIPLRDLPASVTQPGPHTIRVTTLSRTGERSKPVEVEVDLFHEAAVPCPEVAWASAVSPPLKGIRVLPVTDKFDDRGEPVGPLPANYATHNSLFDGQRVRLTAAAGEVLGFQLRLRGDDAVAISCELDETDWRIDCFQALYVDAGGRRIPDPLLPLPATVPLATDRDQAIFADIYVPFDAAPGLYKGRVTVSDGRVVPLELTVLPVQLPRRASFLCEMNSYGLPDSIDDYYALQQIAYDHRVHANILHYSHHTAAPGSRKSNLDMRLRSGRRMDNRRYDQIEPGAKQAFWDDFAEAFGPFLDGSCFAEGHRGPIPAPGFYLTFHESWPLNCRAFFNGNPDAYEAFSQTPVYAETYVTILADFARVAAAHGWHEAGLQVYFNNKGSLHEETKAPWILDEPASFWDYRALQFYGELTDAGRAEAPAAIDIAYRIDVSRPEYCRGQLAARDDFWVVSSSAFQNYRRLVTDRIARDGLEAWVYGTSNPVEESNRQLLAWAVDAWQHGARGLVPWQTVDKSGNALKTADQLGIFIYDKAEDGSLAIRHSARLKAYREAEQLIEYLVLLKQQRNWTPSQMRAFIAHYVPLAGSVRQQHREDAGTAAYASSLLGLDALKQATSVLLLQP